MVTKCWLTIYFYFSFDGWGVGPSGGVVKPELVETLRYRHDRHIAEGPLLVADFVVSAMTAKYGEEWGWDEVEDFAKRTAFSDFYGKFTEPEIPRYTCCEDYFMMEERGACEFAILRREAEIDFTISRRFFRNLNAVERDNALDEAVRRAGRFFATAPHIHGCRVAASGEPNIFGMAIAGPAPVDVDGEDAHAGLLLDENVTAEERGDVAETAAEDAVPNEDDAAGPGADDAGGALGGTLELVRLADDDSTESDWSFDERADGERNVYYFDFRDAEEE